MALPIPAERFTHTPLFRHYPWRSDAFVLDRWEQEAREVEGLKAFADFLARLDQQLPPAQSPVYSHSEIRALLGLPNLHNLQRPQVASNSGAMSKCWTTLLRFQTLDVLLATRLGTSDMPCEVHPVPTGSKQTEVSGSVSRRCYNYDGSHVQLLASLCTWPDRFERFQKAWLRHANKKTRTKARNNTDAPEDPLNPEAGSSAESEAWALVQQLSGMNTRSFVAKTMKNLQAMGTALTWIIEAKLVSLGYRDSMLTSVLV